MLLLLRLALVYLGANFACHKTWVRAQRAWAAAAADRAQSLAQGQDTVGWLFSNPRDGPTKGVALTCAGVCALCVLLSEVLDPSFRSVLPYVPQRINADGLGDSWV